MLFVVAENCQFWLRLSAAFDCCGACVSSWHLSDMAASVSRCPFLRVKPTSASQVPPSGFASKSGAETALSVLAYNLTRVMNIVGTKPLKAAIVA
jgi:hypothetical protein